MKTRQQDRFDFKKLIRLVMAATKTTDEAQRAEIQKKIETMAEQHGGING